MKEESFHLECFPINHKRTILALFQPTINKHHHTTFMYCFVSSCHESDYIQWGTRSNCLLCIWIIHFSGRLSVYHHVYDLASRKPGNQHSFSPPPACNQPTWVKKNIHHSMNKNHLTWLTDACWQKTETLKGSPWTGPQRPGRNRWQRRSRQPTERPRLYTGG